MRPTANRSPASRRDLLQLTLVAVLVAAIRVGLGPLMPAVGFRWPRPSRPWSAHADTPYVPSTLACCTARRHRIARKERSFA